MKKLSVKEMANQTGVSVRTLHYYDEIRLLMPCDVTSAGYRLYDETSLERLQQILFFRELDFSLKEVNSILNHPSYDKVKALKKHKELLILKKNRLDKIIDLVDNTLKGERNMSFKEFDMSEIEAVQKEYAQETKQRYGHTEAFKQSKQKTSSYQPQDWERINNEASQIYQGFAVLMDESPASDAVQSLVREWQDHITKNYYDCTKEILAGLGAMYENDERFAQNIDQYQIGLAKFMSTAIKAYCG